MPKSRDRWQLQEQGGVTLLFLPRVGERHIEFLLNFRMIVRKMTYWVVLLFPGAPESSPPNAPALSQAGHRRL